MSKRSSQRVIGANEHNLTENVPFALDKSREPVGCRCKAILSHEAHSQSELSLPISCCHKEKRTFFTSVPTLRSFQGRLDNQISGRNRFNSICPHTRNHSSNKQKWEPKLEKMNKSITKHACFSWKVQGSIFSISTM